MCVCVCVCVCVCEYNSVLESYHLFRGASVKRLQQWFNSVDHPKSELLTPAKMNASAISFLNGYLDLESLSFELWEDVGVPPLTDTTLSRR